MIIKNVRKEDIIRILKEETCDHCRYLDISNGEIICLNIHRPTVSGTCNKFKKIEDPWTLSDEQVENYRRIHLEHKAAIESAQKAKLYEEIINSIDKQNR